MEGEAPFVEVKPGVYLFAILRGAAFLAPCTFVGGAPISSHDGLLVNYGLIAQTGPELERNRETRTVECMPMLVTFEDVNDPASVKRVDQDDLSAAFGQGFTLRSITIELTDEYVNDFAISEIFHEWWTSYKNKQLDGNRYSTIYTDNEFGNYLNRMDFRRHF